MKKNLVMAATIAAAAVCLAACDKALTETPETAPSGEEVTLEITMEDCSVDGEDTPDTKTIVKNTKEIWWEYGDAVNIYASNSTKADKFTVKLSSGQTAKTAKFSGTFSSSSSTYVVFYPYTGTATQSGELTTTINPNQTARAGSFDKNLMMACASFPAQKPGFTLKPVLGGLRFRVSRTDIKSVSVYANDGYGVAGEVKVSSLGSSNPSVTRTANSDVIATLSMSSGTFQTGVDYFIVLIPRTMTGGITLQMTTTSGKVLEAKSKKDVVVKKGTFGYFPKPINEYAVTSTPTAVDLGLSVKWANCNVGAASPEQSGNFYAWGMTTTMPSYQWKYYKWCNGTKNTLTKYNNNSANGTVDNKSKYSDYNYADDPARVNLGGKWRVPTNAEWQELIDNCTWTWTTQNGVKGCKATSKKSGYTSKSIFIPACGNMYYSQLKNEGTRGYYMLDNVTANTNSIYTMSFFVSQDYLGSFSGNSDRCYGSAVRAVQPK